MSLTAFSSSAVSDYWLIFAIGHDINSITDLLTCTGLLTAMQSMQRTVVFTWSVSCRCNTTGVSALAELCNTCVSGFSVFSVGCHVARLKEIALQYYRLTLERKARYQKKPDSLPEPDTKASSHSRMVKAVACQPPKLSSSIPDQASKYHASP